MRKAGTIAEDSVKLKKRPFPLKRFILGCVVVIVAAVVVFLVIKNAGAGLSEVLIPEGADTQNTYLAKPDSGNPNDLSATDNLFIAAGVLNAAGSFSAQSEGTSTSMGVSQGIRSNRTVVGKKAYKEVVSFSAFVKMGEQRYYNGNDYLIRGSDRVESLDNVSWGDTATSVTKEAYLNRYGYLPNQMTSYILNEESVLSGELVSADSGLYTFHYDLNVDLAPVNLLYEMRTSAGTSNYPKFLSADMTVVMDGDWTVKSIKTSAKYEVAMLGGVVCEESMTETFTQIGGITVLPETEFFSPYFGSETTDEIETQPDALSAILEIFGDYTGGTPLNAKIALSAPGTELDGTTALVRLGLDIENTENITADVRLGGLDFSYKKGALYLSYGDFKGSMTVDNLTEAIGAIGEMFGADLGGLSGIDLDSLLGGLTLTETDDGCVISLDADLGGIAISGAINGVKQGETYALSSVVASIGDVTVTIEPCAEWEVKEFTAEECPDLLGLLDILSDGKISFEIDVNGLTVDVQYDIANNVLNAFIGDITVILQNNTVYIRYNDIKLKLALSDVSKVADDISSLLDALGIDLDMSALPEFDINGILDSIAVASDGETAQFSVNLLGADINVNLANVNNRWTFDGVNGAYGGIAIDARPSAPRPFVTADDGDYASVRALTGLLKSVLSEPLNLKLTLSAEGTPFDGMTAYVRFDVDVENFANTTADIRIGDFDFSYKYGKLYMSYGEFKGSMTTEGLSAALGSVFSMLGLSSDLPSDGFDIAALLGGIQTKETANGCEFSIATELGGMKFGAAIYTVKVDDGYALSSITADIGGYSLTAETCDEWEVTDFIEDECPDMLGLLDIINDGNLSFNVTVGDMNIHVQYDIKNNILNAFVGDVVIILQDQTLYVSYNNIKLKLALYDLSAVIDDLKPVLDALGINLDLSATSDIDIASVLSGIATTSNGETAQFSVNLFGADITVNLTNKDSRWTLDGVNCTLGNIAVSATPVAAKTFVTAGDGEYIDCAAVIGKFAPSIAELITAENFAFNVSLDIRSGGSVYGVNAQINLNGGIAASGTVSVNGMNAIAFDVIYADGVVYLTVNGMDFAFRAGNTTGESVDVKALLVSLCGYNGTVDAVVSDLLRVINAADSGIDFAALIKGLAFDGEALSVVLGGEQFEVNDLTVRLTAGDGLTLGISNFVFGNIGFTASVQAVASTTVVTAPDRQYVTELAIVIDELNTLYVSIDTLNGIYRFRLDDLYGEYSNDTFYMNYSDVYLRGNIKELGNIIGALDDIVKEAQKKYAAGLITETVSNVSVTGDILKSLLNSLTVTANGDAGILKIAFKIFGIDADLSVDCGDSPELTINIGLLGKDVTAYAARDNITYYDFGNVADEKYVDITTVFNDYLDEFETLATSNSWHFDVSAEVEFNGAKYLLAEGSSIDLLYYTSEKYDLKATLIVKTWNGSSYVDAYNITAAYVNGRIYFDYSNASNNSGVKKDNHLKLTLSGEALNKCVELMPRLLEVVPQLDQLIKDMKQSSADAMDNLELVKYSSIIKSATYANGAFGIVINAGVILPALGDIDLTVTRNELGGLSLGIGSITYNDGKGISVALRNVSASVAAQSEEIGNANIGEFTTDGYINLDSLYELLSAFTITADNNSFKLSGTAKVSLVVSVDLGMEIVVDIDDEGFVYVSFRLYREKLSVIDITNVAFKDYGGYSYLNYNGKTNTIRVIRNSYQKEKWYSTSAKLNTEFGSRKPEYDKEMPASEFTENMVDYILEMINFKDWINDQITGAINGEGSGAVYGIEDIIKSYTYAAGEFGVTVDLTPMDSNLGQLSLNILHDENYNLTELTASMGLLSDWCKITVNSVKLLPPTYGEAISRVTNATIW